MKRKLLLMTIGAATFAAQMLGAGTTCITKVGSTAVTSDAAVAGLLEGVSTASSKSSTSGANALVGGEVFDAASALVPLEGGIAVWDYSNVTDYDFTPGGTLLIIR